METSPESSHYSRLLLIGSGGREHALAWKLAQSPSVTSIYCLPGNPGTDALEKVTNVSDVSPDDLEGIVLYAKRNQIDMVIPGPEAPLVNGISEICRMSNVRCFGPSTLAARLEGSKRYSKDFMKRHNLPTASYEAFSKYEDAKAYLDSISHDIVIKASGLAGGKGVMIPHSKEEAHIELKKMMVDKQLGDAAEEVVIEELLKGEELSFLSFCDGYTLKSLPAGQDHKQIYNGDQGPNTGGMGVYAPTAVATKELIDEVHRTILQPTLDSSRKDGIPFKGILFTGLMITETGPKILEYNVRFGDPECQTMLQLLSSDTDLGALMYACCEGFLDSVPMKVTDQYCATVVACAGGYPGSYEKGHPITFSEPPPENCKIFHAGTSMSNDQLVTSGGRVIAATATGSTLDEALASAYKGISTIQFHQIHFRTDIGRRPPGLTARKAPLSYASAGVSISSGNDLVKLIKPMVASTARPGTNASIGGFGGIFTLPEAGYPSSSPTLIGAIDGVGTKLHLAHQMRKHDTVGIDLVAMNVNDLLVQGAEPLFFLDCYTCGTLTVDIAASFISGVVAGCKQSNCALIGGETAEMPGLFTSNGRVPEDGSIYDVVGAAIGALPANQNPLPNKESMKAGDVLLALPSSGVHSNGFSLVRAILARSRLTVHSPLPWGGAPTETAHQTLGEALLAPTKIYVSALLPLARKGLLKGMAHITGGGLVENIPRMLPKHLAAVVDVSTYPLQPVFRWLKEEGNLEAREFARAFNTGVGMVVVVGERESEEVCRLLREEGEGEEVFVVGRLEERGEVGGEGCVLRGVEAWE